MVAVCQRVVALTESINTPSFSVTVQYLLLQINCTGLLDTHSEDKKSKSGTNSEL